MRVFTDEAGTEWTAWEVHPSRGVPGGAPGGIERRGGSERRHLSRAEGPPGRARSDDRRRQASRAVRTLGSSLAGGWLAFQAGAVRRRLTPIPDGWDALTDAALVLLCDSALVARPAIAPIAAGPPELVESAMERRHA